MSQACPYYRVTARGPRCILMDLQEWRRLGKKYVSHCRNGGKGCSLALAFQRKMAAKNKKFLSDVRRNVLWGEEG